MWYFLFQCEFHLLPGCWRIRQLSEGEKYNEIYAAFLTLRICTLTRAKLEYCIKAKYAKFIGTSPCLLPSPKKQQVRAPKFASKCSKSQLLYSRNHFGTCFNKLHKRTTQKTREPVPGQNRASRPKMESFKNKRS